MEFNEQERYILEQEGKKVFEYDIYKVFEYDIYNCSEHLKGQLTLGDFGGN